MSSLWAWYFGCPKYTVHLSEVSSDSMLTKHSVCERIRSYPSTVSVGVSPPGMGREFFLKSRPPGRNWNTGWWVDFPQTITPGGSNAGEFEKKLLVIHRTAIAMRKVYENRRSRGDAEPCEKEKKTGEGSSCGRLVSPRSDPSSDDGGKKRKARVPESTRQFRSRSGG